MAAPNVRQWQTGIVHDYARILKIVIRAGFCIILIPGGITPDLVDFYDSRTIAAVSLWVRSLSF